MNEAFALEVGEDKAVNVGKKVGIFLAVRQTARNALDIVETCRLCAQINEVVEHFSGGAGLIGCTELFKSRIMQTAQFAVGGKAAGADDHAGPSANVENLAFLFDLNAKHASAERFFAKNIDDFRFDFNRNTQFFADCSIKPLRFSFQNV